MPAAPTTWLLPSRHGFPEWAADHLRKAAAKDTDTDSDSALELMHHQRVVRAFLRGGAPYRGMLVFHGLGTGKSCSAIAAAEALSEQGPKALANRRDVVVMLPASLRQNFVTEVTKCGSRAFQLQRWRWQLVPADDAGFLEACARLSVDPRKARRNAGGVLVPDADTGVPFASLPDRQKEQVRRQVDWMVRARYTFVNYNGNPLRTPAFAEGQKNPFSGKVVVIDEVHNLISMATGSGSTGPRLFELLTAAEDVKIIALSGTPIINSPHELAYLVALLKGATEVYRVRGAVRQLRVQLLKDLRVDMVHVDIPGQTVSYSLLPRGYRWTGPERSGIVADVEDDGRNRGSPSERRFPLPLDQEEFAAAFVRMNPVPQLLHEQTLRTRLMACISYFHTYDPRVYPTLRPMQVRRVTMSDHQVKLYEDARYAERVLETKSQRQRQMKKAGAKSSSLFGSDEASVYRVFSRAVCNFAFPENVKRPWPSNLRRMLREEEREGAELPTSDTEYERRVEAAVAAVTPSKLTGSSLARLSPKYVEIVDALRASPGPALVYSQFRKVEGLRMLALALRANGFAELKLKKDSGDEWRLDVPRADLDKPKFVVFSSGAGDKERTRLLLHVFNSELDMLPPGLRADLKSLSKKRDNNLHGGLVKALMITQSGAEGISLRNVRQVHLLEPYWNDIRTKQVIGRAVRAHSHDALPKTERVVDVFMYVAVMSARQMEESFTIRKHDRGQTSDEYIMDVAGRKAVVTDRIAEAMRAAAFDCRLYAATGAADRCHDPAQLLLGEDDGDGAKVSSLALEDDLRSEDAAAARERRVPHVEVNGVRYVTDAAGLLYDEREYAQGRRVVVGQVTEAGVDML